MAADTHYAVIPRAMEWEAMVEAGQPLGLQEGVGPSGLIWPVVGPVVSNYGMRWGRMHEGIDIAASPGTPILAAADGQVVLREWFGGYEQFTCLRHVAALATCYAHQSRMHVRLPQLVRRGQRIGLVGCTGHCFGPHLHFEVHLAGMWSAHERDVDRSRSCLGYEPGLVSRWWRLRSRSASWLSGTCAGSAEGLVAASGSAACCCGRDRWSR